MKTTWTRLRRVLRERASLERVGLPWLLLAFALILSSGLTFVFWPQWNKDMLQDCAHLLGIAILLCFLGFRVRWLLWALFPVVFFGPTILVCRVVTGQLPSEWLFLVIAETNKSEIKEFIRPVLMVLLATLPLASLYVWVVSCKVPAGFRPGLLSAAFVLVCVFLLPLSDLINYDSAGAWSMERYRLTMTEPVGTLRAFFKALALRHQMSRRGDLTTKLNVQFSAPALPPGQREIHLFVLGESTRASSLQLNGYERETTPLLAKTSGVLSFKNVIAPAPATVLSVPMLLTGCNATNVANAPLQPSILNVFRAAGYRVYWLSTQPQFGVWDTGNSYYACDANRPLFLSPKQGPRDSEYATAAQDSALIPQVQKILERNEPKVLIVIHTMGSHLTFSDRYPEEFNRFPADPVVCKHSRDNSHPADVVNLNMRNAYDNTIVFTDYVLSQFIGLLSAEHGVTSLYYVSDHGENDGNAAVLPWAHGNLSTEVLHVPLIIWLSPEYRSARPRQSAALAAHVGLPISSDNTFYTIPDMAGLTSAILPPDHSLASPTFHQGPRLVMHLHDGVADYDKEVLPAEARGGWRPKMRRKPGDVK